MVFFFGILSLITYTGFQQITFWILYWGAISKRIKNEAGLTGVSLLNKADNCTWRSSHESSIPL